MTSPPRHKNPTSTQSRLFEVAVVQKPYYNPAKLEKAASGVKHKEFIQRITEARARPYSAHRRSGPASGHLLLRAARLGSAWPSYTAAHADPQSLLYGRRLALPVTRDVSTPRSSPESRCHLAR